MKKVGGSFIADGNAVNLDLGFVPDKFRAWVALGGTILVMEWFKDLANNVTASGQFGITDTAGTKSLNATAAAGFAAYDGGIVQKVLLPSPSGDGETAASLPNPWTQARSTAATARSATALGTIIKPTTNNVTGYIYECTTAGTGGATEPTWPTSKGEYVTDGSTIWITRDEKVKNISAKGVTIGASIGTDSDEWSYEAELWESVAPEKDAVLFDPVGKHGNS